MRQLLVVRHAIAVDRDQAAAEGVSEFQRYLTDKGRERMKAVAEGATRVLDGLDRIAHSDLVRARETAELLGNAFPDAPLEPLTALRPGGDPAAVMEWLGGCQEDTRAAVVGHEPDLGELISQALAGRGADFAPLKKAGMALLLFQRTPAMGGGELVWSIPPKVLRQLAK